MGILDELAEQVELFVPKNKEKYDNSDKSKFIRGLKTQILYVDLMLGIKHHENKKFDFLVKDLKLEINAINEKATKIKDKVKEISDKKNLWFFKYEDKDDKVIYVTNIKFGTSWFNPFPKIEKFCEKVDGKLVPLKRPDIICGDTLASVKDLYEKFVSAAEKNEFDELFKDHLKRIADDKVAKTATAQQAAGRRGRKPKDTNTDLSVIENTVPDTEKPAIEATNEEVKPETKPAAKKPATK